MFANTIASLCHHQFNRVVSNMRRGLITIFTAAISVFTLNVNATVLTFEQVWSAVAHCSKSQQASSLQLEAAKVGEDRANHHWLPQIYVDGRSYETNDPTLSFMGILSERAVKSSDFAPNSLNHPGDHFYNRGALGIDWPIYEGGAKTAQLAMQHHVVASAKANLSVVKTAQYVEVAKLYGSIRALMTQSEKLTELQNHLSRVLQAYHIGDKTNPVGYSGLLGLKTLALRIKGMLADNHAKQLAYKNALAEMGLKQQLWSPTKFSTTQFVNHYFPAANKGESAHVLSQKQMALARKHQADMEKAKFLPKVGAYAEEYLFNGDRTTANGYSVGLYVRWSLLDPAHYGTLKEARLNAAAAKMHALSMAEQDRSESQGLNEIISALHSNLKLLQQSDKLLREQTKVACRLFKMGSLNAQQLTEMLARRADLIANHTDTELALLNSNAQRATKTNFSLPINMDKVAYGH